MKRFLLCSGLLALLGAAWACAGDGALARLTDARGMDASLDGDLGSMDAGRAALACGDAAGAPPRVLLVQGNARRSELAVVNLATHAVDGRLAFDGGYGTTSSLGTDPYLLGGETDRVTRLDAHEPWRPVASWDVRGDDARDGGDPNANPVAVVPVSCSKAYVLRFNRDRVAVIDPSEPSGGVPTKYVDLSFLRQDGDPSTVEMTSAVYVPSKRTVFALLGNADLSRIVKVNGPFGEETKLLCVASLKPSVVGIDVETDRIVSLGGTAPGGGIALEGYNPPLGTPLIYDAARDRLLVLQAGCNEDAGDGGPGGIIRRRIEQVDLATGAVQTLLSLDTRGFPSSLAYVSGEHAAVAFYFDAYRWDPRSSTLGPPIVGGLDVVARGRGAFIGTRATFVDDGGAGPLEVVSVPLTGAEPSVVAKDPFSSRGGYVAGVEAWPAPYENTEQ